MEKRVYHRETQNGRGHYQVLGANNESNNLRLRPVIPLRPKKGMIKVDAGRQGAIFLASFNKSAKKEFVIKVCPTNRKLKQQISKIEFIISQKLYRVVPRRVPKPLKFFTCTNFVPQFIWENKFPNVNYSKQTVACMEYIENGTFDDYLKRMAASPKRRLNDNIFKTFIQQVLTTLSKIKKKYPAFIHGDLHLRNLLVRPKRPVPDLMFTDFGWSRLNKSIGQFSEWKEKWARDAGIGPNMCLMYDTHFFLFCLREWVFKNSNISKDGLPSTRAFLNTFVPKGYRKENDTHTKTARLKYGHKYPFSLSQILESNYFKKTYPNRILLKSPQKGVKKSNTLNSNLLRVTPQSVNAMSNNNKTRRGLLIAYGAGPTPNKKNNLSIKRGNVNRFRIKSPKYT
jgi:serine/threonine protein kinase